jgi:glycosyltransferase involved in cell wall biosynthesis
MKIVFISYYSGKNFRGVETYVHELANRLSSNNSVTVFQSGNPLPDSKYETVRITNKIVFTDIPRDTDILIPTNGRFQTLFAKLWCLTHPKTKLIISGQSGPGFDDRLNLWCFPDKFIALTKFQENWAKKANPFVSTSIISNGVDLEHFNPQVKPLDIDLPRPVILYVAALETIKRHQLLIQAVSHTNASLLLVGQGSLNNEINRLGQQLLGNKFKIISLPHDQIPSVYPACDLFVYPTSAYESFGIAILEAMASGLPVVATNDPIRREIIGESGWFVDPVDLNDFSQKLTIALTSQPKTKPRLQAEKFSWDTIAKNYSHLCALLNS